VAKTVFDVLLEKFEEDVSSSADFLINGGAKDYAEYREVAGRVRGLRLAVQSTKDLSRSQMDEEDDD
jgi:hypothetical protein